MKFPVRPILCLPKALKAIVSLICLLILTNTAFAQRVSMKELLTYLSCPPEKLDSYMVRNGFICYRSEGGLTNWTCLFAYANNMLVPIPDKASGLIQYVRTCRSNMVVYQLHSKEQCDLLQQELIQLGYTQLDPTTTNHPTFAHNNTIVTCQKAGTTNGISGNYTGYSLTLSRRLY